MVEKHHYFTKSHPHHATCASQIPHLWQIPTHPWQFLNTVLKLSSNSWDVGLISFLLGTKHEERGTHEYSTITLDDRLHLEHLICSLCEQKETRAWWWPIHYFFPYTSCCLPSISSPSSSIQFILFLVPYWAFSKNTAVLESQVLR